MNWMKYCLLSGKSSKLGLISILLCLDICANPFEERFGLGARTKAIGGAGIAQSDDFSAVYYNPANLAFCPKSQVTIGYHNTSTHIKLIKYKERPEQLGSNHSVLIGTCLQLPLRLSLGAYGSFGVAGPVSLQFRTLDNKPRFVLYDHSLASPVAGFGLSLRPISWFSLGLATSITVHTDFSQRIDIPLAPKKLELDMSGVVRPTLPLIAGVTFEPLVGLRIGAVFRTARYNKFEDISVTNVQLGGVNINMKQNLEGSFGFSPMQIGAGLSYNFLNLIVAADLTWHKWSEYRGPFLRIKSAEDSDEFSRIILYPSDENFNFSDIFVSRFGAEYTWKNILSARAGYSFRPSPAPKPAGHARLLDANTHTLSGGGSYRFSWEKLALNTELFLSAHILEKSGWAYDTGLGLTVEY